MKKGSKAFVFAFFAFTLSLIFLSTLVSAAENPVTNAIEKLSEIFSNTLAGNSNYDYVTNILSPQILFGALIFLVVFAIVSRISLFSEPWIKISVSIVVGILSGFFINPAWIQPLLNQYEALGVTITFLLPFVLIFVFLREIAPYNRLIQKAVWSIYFIVLFITYIFNFPKMAGLGAWPHLIYIAMGIGSIIMLAKGKSIYNMLWENELETAMDTHKQIETLITAKNKTDAQDALDTIGATLPAATRAKLQAAINKM